MKIAIIYFSFTKNNEKLATYLSTKLAADIYTIKEERRRTSWRIILDMFFNRSPAIHQLDIDTTEYDHVILVAPIWDFSIAHPMKSFLKQMVGRIVSYSFATICIGRDGQAEKVRKQLLELLKTPPQSLLELHFNDLLPSNKQGKGQGTIGYVIKEEELDTYAAEVDHFLQQLTTAIV